MCSVIRKATEKKPEDRFQNCKDFIKALKKDDFDLSIETKKELIIDPTDLAIEKAVTPGIIEEKPNLSVKENVLEKPVEETITTAETNKANNPKNPEKDKKKIGIMDWQSKNQDLLRETNRRNSLKGAAKVSKKISVETPDGNMLYFVSKSEFQRQTGQWAKTIIDKTTRGLSHNGYKAWES